MQDSIPRISKPKTVQKSGCLKRALILLGIGFLVAAAGAFYLYDQWSGNAEKRFEKKENEKLAKEKEDLPEEYKSYKELSELESTEAYEISSFDPVYPDLYYFLPDSTLVMGSQSDGNFYRINTKGEIMDYYNNPELKFYGSSLMKYALLDSPPVEDDEESAVKTSSFPIFSGYYSNWPLNGDKTLFPIESISKIASDSQQITEAYKKADALKIIYPSGGIKPSPMIVHIGNVWYVSDYVPDKALPKQVYIKRKADQKKYLDTTGAKARYLKRNSFHRARSAGYLSGGMLNYAHWKGDAYLELKIGKTTVLFKRDYTEDKHGRSLNGNPRIYLDILNTGQYAIVENYIIRPKK